MSRRSGEASLVQNRRTNSYTCPHQSPVSSPSARSPPGSAYSRLEDDIIDMLPPTMKRGGTVYTPYSGLAFDIQPDGAASPSHRFS